MEKKNRQPIICGCKDCTKYKKKYIRKYNKIPEHQTTMFAYWEMKG